MNELVFIPAVDAPAHVAGVIARTVDSSPAARQLLAFAAAIAVNLLVLGTLQLSASRAAYAPAGEVLITQLESPIEVRVASN
jgi:hypothetical protein